MDVAWNRYLLDGYHHKMGLAERRVRMRDLRNKWLKEPGVQLLKVDYERYGSTSDMGPPKPSPTLPSTKSTTHAQPKVDGSATPRLMHTSARADPVEC